MMLPKHTSTTSRPPSPPISISARTHTTHRKFSKHKRRDPQHPPPPQLPPPSAMRAFLLLGLAALASCDVSLSDSSSRRAVLGLARATGTFFKLCRLRVCCV